MIKRILNLLEPEEKKQGVKVTASIFVLALLDFVSLASLMPLLYFLMEGVEETKAILGFSIIAFILVTVKSIMSVRLGRFQGKFTMSLYSRLSFRLFSNYYNNGLLFIKEHGYSNLGHSVNYMCYSFSQGIISPLMKILADLLLILLVTAALLIYDWKTVLVLYLCSIPFMVAYILFVRDKIKVLAKEDFNAKKTQARVVADSFRGYQELETNNAFEFLQKTFLDGLDTISNSRLKMDTLQRIPLFISEVAIIAGFLVMLLIGGKNASIMIGIFAIAAFRLIPSLRSILSCYNTIHNSLPCIEVLEDGLKTTSSIILPQNNVVFFCNELKINDVSFAYGEKTIHFGTNIIKKGEYVGICGYSGVGKTTLFNLILGFLEPQKGEILIDGVQLTSANRKGWLKHIGYVPQEVFIFNGSLAQNIALGYTDIDMHKIEQILKMVSLAEWVSAELPDGLQSTLGEGGSKLSGGQKQRIGIARALYKGASVLLLDEATSALDNNTEREINLMLEELRKQYNGLTILSIAHRESTLAYCSRIINLEENGEKDI